MAEWGYKALSLRSILLRKNHVSQADQLSAIQFRASPLALSYTLPLYCRLCFHILSFTSLTDNEKRQLVFSPLPSVSH